MRAGIDELAVHWRTPTLAGGLLGLRSGEVWGLTRADYDVLHGTLHIRHALKDVGGALLPYGASAWRGGQPALGVA